VTVSTLTVVPEASASGTAPCAEPLQLPLFEAPLSHHPTPDRRPRLLDLFCGAGGASAGYHAAGFDVTGVDINPQPDYPFPFIQADALTVDLSGFDVAAASPPCQRFSTATPPSRRAAHPDLVDPIRRRLIAAVNTPGGPWAYVIENVPGAPLHNPVTICGDTLRLGVRRHRLFESNLPLVGTPCWHDRPAPPVAVYGTYGQRVRRKSVDVDGETSPSTDQARAAMGIDWMPWPALTQAIPPAYTHWLGVQLLTHATRADHRSGGYVTPELGACVTLDALTSLPGGQTAGQPSPPPTHGDETRRRITSPQVQAASVTSDTTLPAPAGFRHCRCGTPLPPRPATGRWPRYCSHACRQAAYRDRHRTTVDGQP
jgi:hypothetical protein